MREVLEGTEEIRQGFLVAARKKYQSPDGGDPHIEMMGRAVRNLLRSNLDEPEADQITRDTETISLGKVNDALKKHVLDEYVSIYNSRAKSRPKDYPDSPEYILNLQRCAINARHLERDEDTGLIQKKDTEFPDHITEIYEMEEEVIGSLMLDDKFKHNEPLYRSQVMTNIYWRGFIIKFLSLINSERLGHQPTTLEMGSSLGLSLKWLFRSNERRYRMPHITVYDSDFDDWTEVTEVVDHKATKIINEIARSAFTPGPSHGVDYERAKEPSTELWVASCRYFKEMRDPQGLIDFNDIKQPLEEVTQSQAYCEDTRALKKSVPQKAYNFSFLSFMLNQNNAATRRRIEKNADNLTSDFEVTLENGRPNPSSPFGIDIFRGYDPDSPSSIVATLRDVKRTHKIYEPFMRAKDGRLTDIIINRNHPMMRDVFGF
jgi:hypothetical protein